MLVRICDVCEERFEDKDDTFGIEIIKVDAYQEAGKTGNAEIDLDLCERCFKKISDNIDEMKKGG
ncbi:hypothetical protein D1BOALGB6SA_10299 [Olavius sp. associated proteobacterium Delta 1]|nr:hypothetical protein D1BOALGB6SA_10299 [Olavius sp. associated proteobacterium Delta 1]